MRIAAALMITLIIAAPSMAQDAATTAPARRGRGPTRLPINPALPTLWIIGDSTVLNGGDTGNNGQWGWGNPIAAYFDPKQINIQNRALGGTSSRTYYRDDWPRVLALVKPGDFVIMQFGHNDSGAINDNQRARATFHTNGDESEEIDNILTGKHEVVHSYGWYLRKIVAEAREKGAAMVMICSPIPRNNWPGGAMKQSDYDEIAQAAAKQVDAVYIDLNERIIKKYQPIGQEKVTETYFPQGETTHTDWAGAVLNAETVIDAMKDQKLPLAKYLLPEPPKDLKNPMGKAR